MKAINLKQGTDQWVQFRLTHLTASEAPIMMGTSKYMSRDDLLTYKKTKEPAVVNRFQQVIFDKGHEAERMARPIVEKNIGEELYPVVGTEEIDGLPLLVSLDGITMCEETIFEHKQFNKELFEIVKNKKPLPPNIYWQIEQQLLVSGAKKCIFVCSDGTEDNFAQCEYVAVRGRSKKLIDGWKQFVKDLESHVPQIYEKVEPETIRDLPAITYNIDKSNGIALKSNLDVFKVAAYDLVEKASKPLETDQDFANAESMIKVFKSTEDKLSVLQDAVLGEVHDIDAFVKDIREIQENIRKARLASEKQVKTRKDELRSDIKKAADVALDAHMRELAQTISGVVLPKPEHSFDEAMKGKKTLKSLNEAVNDELARAKVEATQAAELVRSNLEFLNKDEYQAYRFLFNDLQQVAFKPHDDFTMLVKVRVSEHKEQERQREEEQRKRIQAEEQAKAEAEAQAKARAQAQAEAQAQQSQQQTQAEPEPQQQQQFDYAAIDARIANLKNLPNTMALSSEQELRQQIETLSKFVPTFDKFGDRTATVQLLLPQIISKLKELLPKQKAQGNHPIYADIDAWSNKHKPDDDSFTDLLLILAKYFK